MRTLLAPSWSNPDLTGNSTIVEVANKDIYIVSNLENDSFSVLRSDFLLSSSQNGQSFFPEATYTFTTPYSTFDPAIFYDNVSSLIHIIGCQSNLTYTTGLVDIVYFTFDTTTKVLSTPSVLATTAFLSAYDIIATPTKVVVVTSLTNSPSTFTNSPTPNPFDTYETSGGQSDTYLNGQYLVEIDIVGSVVQVPTILLPTTSSNLLTEFSFGGVSLVTDTTGDINLFYIQHPSLTTGEMKQHFVYQQVLTGSWSTTPLFTYSATFSDDKLTVVPFLNGSSQVEMMLSNCFYVDKELTPRSAVAYFNGAIWTDMIQLEIINSDAIPGSFFEPTLSVDTDGNYTVAYLIKPNGLFQIAFINKDSSSLITTLIPSDWTRNIDLYYSSLRGSKNPISSDNSDWFLVASQQDGLIPLYQSGLHPAPIAGIFPSSVTSLVRGEAVTFLSTSYSSDGLPLTTTWNLSHNPTIPYPSPLPSDAVIFTHTDTTATLLVNKNYGPTAQDFIISLSITDSLLSNSTTATATLPRNYPAFVTWEQNPILTIRGETYIVTPIIYNYNGNALTYTYTQLVSIDGSEVDWSNEEEVVTIPIIGTNVFGETLIFRLTITDGINPPVSTGNINHPDLALTVPARLGTQVEEDNLTRSVWGGVLGNRNNPSSWSPLSISAISSNFNKCRMCQTSTGNNRQVLVSPSSVAILGDGENFQPYSVYYRKRFLTDSSKSIIDAWQTETDSTLVLSLDGLIFRYDQAGTFNCSDSPFPAFINLTTAMNSTSIASILDILVSPAVDDTRMMAISTNYGLFLAEIKDNATEFLLNHFLILTVENHLLLGGNRVTFVRFDGVENMHVGNLLVGTTDGSQFYETLIDLTSRHIIKAWDESTLSSFAPGAEGNSGEIL